MMYVCGLMYCTVLGRVQEGAAKRINDATKRNSSR